MTESVPAKNFIVPPPFDSKSLGDCIIRTPDGTEFKVVKAILYLGSPIFRDMFDIPPVARADDDEANMPTIPVEEDAETIQAFLQMLYPIEPPRINSLSLAQALVAACDKYFVSTNKVQIHLQKIFSNSQSLKEDPLACYALCWRLGLEEEAIAASRHCHQVDISDRGIAKKLVSQSGNVDALTQLWNLRMERERRLDGFLALAKVDQYVTCESHSQAVFGIIPEYQGRKDALRRFLMVPDPVCEDVEVFLTFKVGQGRHNCSLCTDKRRKFIAGIQLEVAGILRNYPKAIQGPLVPEGTME